jgi:hypothetical protein
MSKAAAKAPVKGKPEKSEVYEREVRVDIEIRIDGNNGGEIMDREVHFSCVEFSSRARPIVSSLTSPALPHRPCTLHVASFQFLIAPDLSSAGLQFDAALVNSTSTRVPSLPPPAHPPPLPP